MRAVSSGWPWASRMSLVARHPRSISLRVAISSDLPGSVRRLLGVCFGPTFVRTLVQAPDACAGASP